MFAHGIYKKAHGPNGLFIMDILCAINQLKWNPEVLFGY